MLALKDEARSVGGAKNGRVGSPVEGDSTIQAHQERRESNAKATTSATAGPAGVRPSQQKPAAQDRKRKQPSDNDIANNRLPQRAEEGAAGDVQPANKARQSAPGLVHKLTKTGSASIAHDSPEAAHTAGSGSKPGVPQHGNQAAASAPFALPGSASTPSATSRPLSQTTSIPGGMSGSTRISLPPKLTQLTSLRSKPPPQELKADSSPADSETETEEAAAAAAAAAVEAHLKGVTQQFDAMLHNTLQRTKESVHKVTQFAVRAAAGKHGKTAAHRLVIMILDLIETAQMSKRVDLFYLLDSLLQVGLLVDECSTAWTAYRCRMAFAFSASRVGHSMRIVTYRIACLVHTSCSCLVYVSFVLSVTLCLQTDPAYDDCSKTCCRLASERAKKVVRPRWRHPKRFPG